MISVTHFVFGLALAYVFDKRLVTASAFALVPDFDITFSFLYPFSHRGITHTLLAGVVFTFLVYAYSEERESAESCFLGHCSHLSADIITSSGIPLLFPFFSTFSLDVTSAYSLEANLAIISGSLTSMWLKKNTGVFERITGPGY